MLKKLALLVVASSFMLTAKADIILTSSASNTTNNSGYATVNTPSNPAWYGPLSGSSWVSYAVGGDLNANTGNPSSPDYYVVPNGTDVTFYSQTFSVSKLPSGGTLDVLADDTANVYLNGNLIFAASAGPFPTCSSTPIGCLMSTEGVINLSTVNPSDWNVGGSNQFSFQVFQENSVSYGLNYSAVVSTPEPGMLLMLGMGLVGLLVMGRRNFAGNFAN
jgi:hypothetical protein